MTIDGPRSAELGRLADANLLASWASLGSNAGGSVGQSDRSTFVASGIPVAFFNGAFVTGRVADPGRVVADAAAFMAEREVPWLLWVREGIDDGLLAAGRSAGLRDAGGPPGMVLPSIPPSPPAPDELDITIVSDTNELETFRDLTARGFDMPLEIVNRFVAEQLLDVSSITMVVGSVDATPVSCALVSVTGVTAGIYNVATPAEHRRRGYGAAVTWAAIDQGARQGCDHSILQASDMGAPIYRSMGFVDIGRYVQLEGPPTTN